MGQIMVAGRLIHDWKKFGVLSVREILEHSSDVGAIKVALRLGAPRFYDTIRAFGIGQPTGIELPGENRGLLRPIENWSASSIGSLAMGQEVSVTPIQIVSAISAVANGGTLYRPHIVREIDGGEPGALRAGSRASTSDGRQNGGDDSRDDGGRGAGRNGQARAAGRLHGCGEIGHGAKDRSGDGTLFGDAVQLVVRGLRAGEQSGDHDSGGSRFAGGRRITAEKWAARCSSASPSRCWRIATSRTTCPRHPTSRRRRTCTGRRGVPRSRRRTECGPGAFSGRRGEDEAAERGAADGRVWRFNCSCGSKSRGPDGSRRDRGVFAIGTDAVADRQRSCTGTVSASRGAGPARQPRDGAIWTSGRGGAGVGAR